MFELNGKEYSLEQVEAAASASNLSLDEYIKKAGLTTIEPVKTTPTTPDAVVEETAASDQPDTELPSEDTFLELPKKDNRVVEFNIKGKKTYTSYSDLEKDHGDVETWVKNWNDQTNTGVAKIITPAAKLEEVVVEGDAAKMYNGKSPGEYLLQGRITNKTFQELETDEIVPMVESITKSNPNISVYEYENVVNVKDTQTGQTVELLTKTNFANEADAKISYNKLVNLLNKKFTPKQVAESAKGLSKKDEWFKGQSAIIKNQFKNSEERKKFLDTDLFKKETKQKIVTTFGTFGNIQGEELTIEVKPYEN